MSDIASNIGNAIIKPERGTRWRFVAASCRRSAVATSDDHLSDYAWRCYLAAQQTNTFGKDFSLVDSVGCCGCVVHLEHPDRVPCYIWWRVSFFFDRDGKEANVFVWSEPEKTFFRQSFDWFTRRRV